MQGADRPKDPAPDRPEEPIITSTLQSILALLDVQASRSGEAAVRDALETAARRIAAIGKVHACARQRAMEGRSMVDLGRYLTSLIEESRPYRNPDQDQDRTEPGRTLHVAIQALPVAPAVAQQVGLILSELMDNALRFGTGQGGRIWVTGDRLPGGTYRLCVEDDGLGLPAGFALRGRHGGLGLQIVCLAAEQIGAVIVADGDSGARFTLTLPIPPDQTS